MNRLRGDAGALRVLVAVALTLVSQVEIWLTWQPDPDEAGEPIALASRAAAGVAALAFTLSLALPGRYRLVSLALALPAVGLALGGPLDTSIALTVALGIVAFLAAIDARSRAELVAGLGGVAAVIVVGAVSHPDAVAETGDLLVLAAVIAGPWLAGLAIRLRRERESQLQGRADSLEAARDAEVAAATTQERARIARELHDVVAHAISVIVLQARGGRHAIADDPAAAGEAFDAIETTAAMALAEMRRLVDVVRPEAEPGSLAPQPGLGHLDDLLARVRDAGLPVELSIEGEAVDLPPGLDLAAYRVIQELLTNALRHAGAAVARVVIRYEPSHVELEIQDDGSGVATAAGRGTVGMRERTALYGGSLEVGPRPGGGFAVLARLPFDPGAT